MYKSIKAAEANCVLQAHKFLNGLTNDVWLIQKTRYFEFEYKCARFI